MDNNIDRQKKLELEGVDLGIRRYHDTRIKTIQNKNKDNINLTPEAKLLQLTIGPMIKALTKYLITRKGGGGRGKYLQAIDILFKLPVEELSFLTIRHCLQITSKEPLQHTCVKLGDEIEKHLEYVLFKQENPGYVKKVEERINSSHMSYKHRVLTHARHKLKNEDLNWSGDLKLIIGLKLVELFVQSTGLFKMSKYYSNKKIFKSLEPTKYTRKLIEACNEKCELLSPVFLPMVCKPKPWAEVHGGGFLSEYKSMRIKLVRTRHKDVLKRLSRTKMPKVYDALNTIQNTPWKINTWLLDIMKECVKTGLGGLPIPDVAVELPPKFWTTNDEFKRYQAEDPNKIKTWKLERAKIYDDWYRSCSKRSALAFKIWLAERFKSEKAIYFVYNLDWRGRIYPLQPFLNPQADDSGKALLQFANGKPLGKRGAFWLAVHGANCFGYDKVSYEDRVIWVQDNQNAIIDSAKNPLDGSRFWTKADDPFKFLAFCKSWLGHHEQGESFIDYTPIAMDGTCSGLQHFTALLRDPEGAKYVNLIPQEKPSDIYARVAEVSNEIINQDTDERALIWRGKVDRSFTKRNTMTLPYGATLWGFRDQLVDELRKNNIINQTDLVPYARYLAETNRKAIGKVVIKASEAMEWLHELARILGASGYSITWTTPTGLPVTQKYFKRKSQTVKTFWGGTRIEVNIQKDTEKIDANSMVAGLPPNLIHSFDASHLMLTVLGCKVEGITDFALIHDSFGCHACDTDALHRILRDEFIKMYSDNLLERFYKEVIAQIPEEIIAKIPPIPKMGDLDINRVRESRYFFN